VRPGDLRHAEWTEFDINKAEWRFPAGNMKMKEQHIVPLPIQAVAILPERRKMMQQWADYLDKLRTGADVIPLYGQAAKVLTFNAPRYTFCHDDTLVPVC